MRLAKIKKGYLVATAALAMGAMICLPRFASAAVTGVCSDCHTMHNSQNGDPMTFSAGFDTTNGSATPNDILLRGNCLQCHTGINSTGGTTPFVYSTTDPTAAGPGHTLAGGNFYWTVAVGGGGVYDAFQGGGHDVNFLKTSLHYAFTTPPGYTDTGGPAGTWDPSTKPLTCAGTYGCHGNRWLAGNYAAISGAHHSDPGGGKSGVASASITKTANSFRFLNGVKGTEVSDWEFGAASASHNEYYGLKRSDDTTAVTVPNSSSETISISQLCAECHGAFHNSSGSYPGGSGIQGSGATMASPWIRHPTDFDMGEATGADYTAAMLNDYNPNVPVGRSTLSGLTTTSTISSDGTATGVAIVMCISCHRAHGSPYADLLRWKYGNVVAGTSNPNYGCFVCHTTKD